MCACLQRSCAMSPDGCWMPSSRIPRHTQQMAMATTQKKMRDEHPCFYRRWRDESLSVSQACGGWCGGGNDSATNRNHGAKWQRGGDRTGRTALLRSISNPPLSFCTKLLRLVQIKWQLLASATIHLRSRPGTVPASAHAGRAEREGRECENGEGEPPWGVLGLACSVCGKRTQALMGMRHYETGETRSDIDGRCGV